MEKSLNCVLAQQRIWERLTRGPLFLTVAVVPSTKWEFTEAEAGFENELRLEERMKMQRPEEPRTIAEPEGEGRGGAGPPVGPPAPGTAARQGNQQTAALILKCQERFLQMVTPSPPLGPPPATGDSDRACSAAQFSRSRASAFSGPLAPSGSGRVLLQVLERGASRSMWDLHFLKVLILSFFCVCFWFY